VEYYSAIKKNRSMSVAGKMDENGDHNIKQNKPDSERQLLHIFSHAWNLDLKYMYTHVNVIVGPFWRGRSRGKENDEVRSE
jgi:hypothetical protein